MTSKTNLLPKKQETSKSRISTTGKVLTAVLGTIASTAIATFGIPGLIIGAILAVSFIAYIAYTLHQDNKLLDQEKQPDKYKPIKIAT